MTTIEKDLGKGGFIYMMVLTALIFIALIATALFMDTPAIMKSPDPGPIEAAMWLIMCLSIPFVLYHSALTVLVVVSIALWLVRIIGGAQYCKEIWASKMSPLSPIMLINDIEVLGGMALVMWHSITVKGVKRALISFCCVFFIDPRFHQPGTGTCRRTERRTM